jgi:hypothetical protein
MLKKNKRNKNNYLGQLFEVNVCFGKSERPFERAFNDHQVVTFGRVGVMVSIDFEVPSCILEGLIDKGTEVARFAWA